MGDNKITSGITKLLQLRDPIDAAVCPLDVVLSERRYALVPKRYSVHISGIHDMGLSRRETGMLHTAVVFI